MTQYIDKAAIVAEIKKRKKEWQYGSSIEAKFKKEECDDILSFLDTLEVKEVDLDKEIKRYRMNNPIIGHKEGSLYDYMANVAKYFFELGLKAQKGE